MAYLEDVVGRRPRTLGPGVQESITWILHLAGHKRYLRFNNKPWTIWQVHHATKGEIQGPYLISFVDDKQVVQHSSIEHMQGRVQSGYNGGEQSSTITTKC